MNTYVSAFWIATTVFYLLNWNRNPGWLNTAGVGLSAGLAILTKGTAYVFLPFMVLACWWLGSRGSRLLFIKRAAVFLLLIFALNGPQFYRCYALTGQPFGQKFPDIAPELELKIPHPGIKATLSNIIRNLTLHLGTPFLKVNEALSKTIRGVLEAWECRRRSQHGLGPFEFSRQSIHPARDHRREFSAACPDRLRHGSGVLETAPQRE